VRSTLSWRSRAEGYRRIFKEIRVSRSTPLKREIISLRVPVAAASERSSARSKAEW